MTILRVCPLTILTFPFDYSPEWIAAGGKACDVNHRCLFTLSLTGDQYERSWKI